MGTNTGKLAGGLLLLISVWVGVYWLYEPSVPPIRQDQRPTDAQSDGLGAATPSARDGAPVLPALVKMESTNAGRAQAQRAIEVVPPEFFEYTVQPGDTFEAVSKRFYGSSDGGGAITRMNGNASAAKLMTPGRTIKIAKDPRNIQGQPVETSRDVVVKEPTVAEATLTPKAQPQPSVLGKSLSTKQRTYVVQSGDSLSKIAKKYYDNASEWERIYEANTLAKGGTMKGPHDLRVGAVLVVPE